jgi:hypothetical protein
VLGGENEEAAKPFEALEEISGLDIQIAVVRVLDLGALAEQGVGLLEDEDRSRRIGA